MSKYDFGKLTDRTGISSLKWDVGEGELPMWVADMDFEVCPEITAALSERLKKPTFGYCTIGEEWYQAYLQWWKTRHGFEMQSDWLMFSTGVVPSLSSIVRRLTQPAEKVVLLTPCYNIFFNSVLNNGRIAEECALDYAHGAYSINFKRLEKCLSDPQSSLLILCNPHNPVGKIWDKKTLAEIGRLCKKHGVIVVSDEIHCDITAPGKGYIPYAGASEECKDNSVTLISPTKSFNLAGIQTSAIAVPDPMLRHKIMRGINNDEIAEPNSFATLCAVAAFNGGGEWLDEMREYVFENRRIAVGFIQREIPLLTPVNAEATYLLWIDCGRQPVITAEGIRKKTGLYLSDGAAYGSAGKGFLRMNLACPRQRLYDGLERLKRAVYE